MKIILEIPNDYSNLNKCHETLDIVAYVLPRLDVDFILGRPTIKKYNICNIADAVHIGTIWESNPSIFPKYVCEIKKINNDIIQSLSNSIITEGNYVMTSLYKNLKINNIII